MDIAFSITDMENKDVELLRSIFGCDDEQLNTKLNKIARASFEEYSKMIIGQKIFTRGRDYQEYRLFLLIKHFFDGIIPEEQKICNLFQISANESRSLIKSIMSKYQYELKEVISCSLKEVALNIQKDENSNVYKIAIHNLYFKDELNRILGSIDTSLPMIDKEKGTISTYIIKPSSYVKICEFFDIQIGD